LSWDASGYAGHTETSIEQPATTWYLAEGATNFGFDLFYLIQNRTPPPRPCQSGTSGPAACRRSTSLHGAPGHPVQRLGGPRADPEGSGVVPLAATDVSARITSDLPVIVERAVYLTTAGRMFRAGHCGPG